MKNQSKTIFAVSGSISCLATNLFILFIIYGFLNEKEFIGEITLFDFTLSENIIYLLMYCAAIFIVFGWVAVISGNMLKCLRCKKAILKGELLTCKPVWVVFRGHQLCPKCLKLEKINNGTT